MTRANTLLFNKAPATWEEYLPLGNGRLGVMLAAQSCNEVLQLNEEAVWSGGPRDRSNQDARSALEKVRALLRQGRIEDAQELAFEELSGFPLEERAYQTAGDFRIDFFDEDRYGIKGQKYFHETPEEYLSSYKSTLDLSNACAEVSYTNKAGISFTRRVWVSAPDDMIFLHVKASAPASVNFRGFLDRAAWADKESAENGFCLLECSGGIPFCAGAGAVAAGGRLKTSGPCLTGVRCDEALIFIDIRAYRAEPGYVSEEAYARGILNNTWKPAVLRNLERVRSLFSGVRSAEDFESVVDSLYKRHTNEYKSWYDRLTLVVGDAESLPDTRATPDLLKNSPESTLLLEQYFNFSRYLLISSSRAPGTLPATLQGIWCGSMDPKWGSKYTVNINLEMNYWGACPSCLPELEAPLFNLLERAWENGRRAAKGLYGCRGYVIHHNTDIWGDSVPQSGWMPGTYWVLGAAWLATNIWNAYEYTQDAALLKRYYYLMHDAALFFADFLSPSDEKAPDGEPYLIVSPSASPENSYITKDGQRGGMCAGCEMDNMILEHLLTGCLKSREILGDDAVSRDGKKEPDGDFEAFKHILSRLKKPSLNSDGTLMEWNEEVKEVEPGHRHISHLYGLFPGITISPEKTPALAEAARKTIEKRLKNGGGHTGWSQAWIINFRTALYEGNMARSGLMRLFTHSTLPNLLDTHPPFQIDGNFGAVSGILRIFLQSEIVSETAGVTEVNLRLLPALPDDGSWSSGAIKGALIRGNVRVSLIWRDGKPVSLTLTSGNKKTVRVNIFRGGSDKARESAGGLSTLITSVTLSKGEEKPLPLL